MSTDRDKATAKEAVAKLDLKRVNGGSLLKRPWELEDIIATALAAERAALLKSDGPLADRISQLVYEHSTIEGDVLVVEDGQALRQAIELLVVAERAATVKAMITAVPASWLDSLLSGPDAVIGKPPYGCPDVERLLNAVQAKLREVAALERAGGRDAEVGD